MAIESGWEKHLQTWMLGLLTLAVLGFGRETILSSNDIGVIKVQVDHIQASIREKMGDRYTGSDHRAYSELDSLRSSNTEKMVLRNQVRIKELEDRLNGND
jgi:hypothetical protein